MILKKGPPIINSIDMVHAVKLLNKVAASLNKRNHLRARRFLIIFDKLYKDVPLPLLYAKLIYYSELSIRTHNSVRRSLSEISSHLSYFDSEPHMKFNLLLSAGSLEILTSRLGISSSFILEALVLAESMGEKFLIARVYDAVSQMFALRYPGMAIYFLRKSEKLYSELGHINLYFECRMKRALLYAVIVRTHRNSEKGRDRFKQEAECIVSELFPANLSAFELNYFRYIKAFVLRDEKELKSLLDELKNVDALPDRCRYEENIIGICIEKGLWEEAISMYNLYESDLKVYNGDSETIRLHLEHLRQVIRLAVPTDYIPFHISRSESDPVILFDILDHYCLEDDLFALGKSVIRKLFTSYGQEGTFEAIKMPDGNSRLFPASLAFNVYYRGQSSYFEESYPSLYRKGVSPAQCFVERVRLEELKKCINDYPITSIFRKGIEVVFPDGNKEPCKLTVDELALAQHYGIKTELMDLTTDKFVAAFFATSSYDKINDTYSPIMDKTDGKGVFYRFCDGIPDFSKVSAVGLQPFSRPGEQSGLVYYMERGQNFNHVVRSKDFFEHHPEVSLFIFNYMNRSEKLFPNDFLTEHAKKIVGASTLSIRAYEQAKANFYPDTHDDILKSYLKEQNIKLSDDIDFSFSEEEKEETLKRWNNGGCEKTLSQIRVRYYYVPNF